MIHLVLHKGTTLSDKPRSVDGCIAVMYLELSCLPSEERLYQPYMEPTVHLGVLLHKATENVG
jgi:hypothetical protein